MEWLVAKLMYVNAPLVALQQLGMIVPFTGLLD